MKRAIILAIAAMSPAAAHAATVTPTEAARMALKQCIEHVSGMGRVEGGNGKNLDLAGFAYQREAPDFLAVTQNTILGRAEYARAPASEGEVWAIGYDKGSCMIVSLGTATEAIEAGYKTVFEEPGTWRKASAPSAPAGQRNERYQYDPQRTLKLSALINIQPAQGITSVTLSRSIR
jgi:hypothetical protein